MEEQLIPYIQRLFPGTADAPVANGDDAAVVATTDRTAVTVDTQVENVHFSWDWGSAGSLGERLVGVVLSDLAAMGAKPSYGVLSLMVPREFSLARVRQWLRGVQRRSMRESFQIIGGDVTRAAAFGAVLTAFGDAPLRPLTRKGAGPGDVLCVTGPIGESAWELRQLLAHRRKRARRWLAPPSRIELGVRLAHDERVTAAMDISDGLFLDSRRMAAASGCGLLIDLGWIPVVPPVRRRLRRLSLTEKLTVLGGGEDYELLVVVKGGSRLPEGLTPIGRFQQKGLTLRAGSQVHPWPASGHWHR